MTAWPWGQVMTPASAERHVRINAKANPRTVDRKRLDGGNGCILLPYRDNEVGSGFSLRLDLELSTLIKENNIIYHKKSRRLISSRLEISVTSFGEDEQEEKDSTFFETSYTVGFNLTDSGMQSSRLAIDSPDFICHLFPCGHIWVAARVTCHSPAHGTSEQAPLAS
ncbi:BQ5605_C005g03436 [Microbotryum silenes-dioicae]|uniref:BQ5605_C005g03436 protein n=1 Tax=Microbotryum silenes-dioicae TaxID=796604 RepID=A0A2X0N4P3_9BASI|nr:BQ5605_C005g03436 [Microbotryum silenes-dioicae]